MQPEKVTGGKRGAGNGAVTPHHHPATGTPIAGAAVEFPVRARTP